MGVGRALTRGEGGDGVAAQPCRVNQGPVAAAMARIRALLLGWVMEPETSALRQRILTPVLRLRVAGCLTRLQSISRGAAVQVGRRHSGRTGEPGVGHQQSFATRSKTGLRHAGEGQPSCNECVGDFGSTQPSADGGGRPVWCWQGLLVLSDRSDPWIVVAAAECADEEVNRGRCTRRRQLARRQRGIQLLAPTLDWTTCAVCARLSSGPAKLLLKAHRAWLWNPSRWLTRSSARWFVWRSAPTTKDRPVGNGGSSAGFGGDGAVHSKVQGHEPSHARPGICIQGLAWTERDR